MRKIGAFGKFKLPSVRANLAALIMQDSSLRSFLKWVSQTGQEWSSSPFFFFALAGRGRPPIILLHSSLSSFLFLLLPLHFTSGIAAAKRGRREAGDLNLQFIPPPPSPPSPPTYQMRNGQGTKRGKEREEIKGRRKDHHQRRLAIVGRSGGGNTLIPLQFFSLLLRFWWKLSSTFDSGAILLLPGRDASKCTQLPPLRR